MRRLKLYRIKSLQSVISNNCLLFFLYIGRNILKCPVITLTLLIPGTLLQANELQQSYNTVLDATKDSVKKLADEWIKEP